jgi:hypothetical protein
MRPLGTHPEKDIAGIIEARRATLSTQYCDSTTSIPVNQLARPNLADTLPNPERHKREQHYCFA